MIEGVDHIGIAVSSIEESRGFYEALGLYIEEIEFVEAEGVRVAMIPCGGSRIELLEATREDSPIARFIEKRGPGLHHICLATGDVRADDAALRARGVRVLRDEPTRGAGGTWIQFVHPQSASGVLVELAEDAGGGAGGHKREDDAAEAGQPVRDREL